MVITNYAKSRISLAIGNSGTFTPTFFVIGSGSGVALPTQTTLFNEKNRQEVTNTTLTTNKVQWTGDWNSLEVSGLSLSEFGLMVSGPALTGSIASRTSIPSVSFDGSNELRIVEVWEVY